MQQDRARVAAGYPRFLDRIDDSDRDWLKRIARRHPVPPRGLIFSQSEPINDIFIVESGRAKAFYTTTEGQSITFAYWIEGMLMGVPGVSAGFDHMWTAEAVVPTVLLRIRRTDLMSLIDRNITAAKAMIEILEFKSKYLSRLAQILGTASVAERLGFVLRNLCELYGAEDADGTRITLPLTHAEIAGMVGASRQWVTVSLGRLERDDLIRVRNRHIIVRARCGEAEPVLSALPG